MYVSKVIYLIDKNSIHLSKFKKGLLEKLIDKKLTKNQCYECDLGYNL